MVIAVGLPAMSFNTTVTSNGAPPGQVTGTHVSVLIAATGAEPAHVAEPPSETHRLLAPAPSDAGRPAASGEVVRPHTLNRPWLSSMVGPKNCPAVGCVTVRFGAVVSTGKLLRGELPVTPFAFRQVATTW